MKRVIMSLATEGDAVGNSYEHKKEKVMKNHNEQLMCYF